MEWGSEGCSKQPWKGYRGLWHTAISLLSQPSTAPDEPLGAEQRHQDQKRARRVAQMQGALLDDFVLQVTIEDSAEHRGKIGVDFCCGEKPPTTGCCELP